MKLKTGFIILIITLISSTAIYAQPANLIKNSGFEEGLSSWNKNVWDKNAGVTDIKEDTSEKHSSGKSVCIINNSENDSRLEQEIKVDKNSYYKLSCWIKTGNVGQQKKGANLSIAGLLDMTKDIKGTSQWQYVEMYGKTGSKQQSFTLTIGLGGYSSTNTGKAWFDDVSVEKVDKLPSGTNAVLLYKDETPAPDNARTGSKGTESETPMLVYSLFFIIASVFAYYFLVYKKKSINPSYDRVILIAILGVGLLARLIIAQRVEGFSIDINCFKAWSSAAAKNLPNFYNTGMFCDYPPFYIIILSVIGKIASIPGMGAYHTLLVKLPSIAADIATAYLLYIFSKKHQTKELGLLAAAFYVLNPAVLINSTLWGQVDSFFTLMIVTALLLVSKDKIALSSIVFSASVLMKPQGIIFLPVLLYELIKRKSIKNFIVSAVSGFATALVIILPFSRDPMWIINLYTKTASGYTYASLNAFNFMSLLGANLRQDADTLFIFSYNTWGNILALLVVAFTLSLYIFLTVKNKNPQIAFLAALVQITGVFVLWSRMHERYMFPAVALCIFAFIFLKDKRFLPLTAILSATIYINTHVVLYRMLRTNNPHVPPDDPVLFWVSLVNVLLLCYLVKVAVDVVFRNKIQPVSVENAAIQTKPKPKVKHH